MILRVGMLAVLAVAVLECGCHAETPTQAVRGGMALEVSVAPDSRSGLPSPVLVAVSLSGGQILDGNLVLLDEAGAVLAQAAVGRGSRVEEQLVWSGTQVARRLDVKLRVRDAGGTEQMLDRTLSF